MKISSTDIENYDKYDEKKRSGIFANVLAQRLREKYPQQEIGVRHYDPAFLTDYQGALYSDIYETTGTSFFGFFSRRNLIARVIAPSMINIGWEGVAINGNIGIRGDVEEEAMKLNEQVGGKKEIIYL